MEAVKRVQPFELPQSPAGLVGPVKAWSEAVTIPSYAPMPPDKNPMFLERRVYQGSSGRVYPIPFTDRISTERKEHSWQAVHIENEFLRVMILPEIGGRIHIGFDKTSGYDFFYRQNVIKPALVGLAGPWISGGVEFNWPQHHRPATFMPVDFHIEEASDGSRTVWLSDHDPMNRLKGMHGVCLRPGSACLELKVRLYNRTAFTQTFLWWANVGVHVHEQYQSVFPQDVRYVADHAKRATSTFPLCEGVYYGVDYGRRAKEGVPASERPPQFAPPGNYSPNDLSWYANIPVPTSYMALGSREDFFGGYDHAQQAGFIHVADHRIAPGKKQWTWGNHDFGYAWDRNLTDDDGPYIELMAGVYTDNQPDFSFLAPGETKAFRQYWYPIQQIGPPRKANAAAAVSLNVWEHVARIGVYVTREFKNAVVRLETSGALLAEWKLDLAPGKPILEEANLPSDVLEAGLTLVVSRDDGEEIIRHAPSPHQEHETPGPACEPPEPEQIETSDDLYLTGLHLQQYRHATWEGERYWREALRRDSGDVRSNNALGLAHLRRGEFAEAEAHFRQAIRRLTGLNPNPFDGEPYYNLGLTLRFLGKEGEAYDAFYKATWNYAWRAAALHAIAELDMRSGNWTTAIEHLNLSLRFNADNLNARNLATIAMRKLGKTSDAEHLLLETLSLDPLDSWARYLRDQSVAVNNQTRIDIALDNARSGLYDEAIQILADFEQTANDGSQPIVLYALGYFHSCLGNAAEAQNFYARAASARPDYCFPSRLEELLILRTAIEANPRDARAPYYLGNLLYDRRRHREAITYWERAAKLDPAFATVWRNLGIGYFNVFDNATASRQAFDRAFQANSDDARVLYERDQLWKRLGEAPERRLGEIERFPELVKQRDDLLVESAALYNQTGQHLKALAVLESRRFQPWEGGEGLTRSQYVRSYVALGLGALRSNNSTAAISYFHRALSSPPNLGEAKHLLEPQSNIYYWLGVAHQSAGDEKAARDSWTQAAASAMNYYSALALRRLGKSKEADKLLRELLAEARNMTGRKATIDYFATSLPTMLLFKEDLEKRNSIASKFLEAQASCGLGQMAQARQLLDEVLQLDRNHMQAADLLVELDLAGTLRPFVPA